MRGHPDGRDGARRRVHGHVLRRPRGLALWSVVLGGSDAQKAEWLPKMLSMEVIGAFGLTEPKTRLGRRGRPPHHLPPRGRRVGDRRREEVDRQRDVRRLHRRLRPRRGDAEGPRASSCARARPASPSRRSRARSPSAPSRTAQSPSQNCRVPESDRLPQGHRVARRRRHPARDAGGRGVAGRGVPDRRLRDGARLCADAQAVRQARSPASS